MDKNIAEKTPTDTCECQLFQEDNMSDVERWERIRKWGIVLTVVNLTLLTIQILLWLLK